MTFDSKHGMRPESFPHPVVAQQTYDVSSGLIKFALDWQTRSLVLDFQNALGGGAAVGSVSVFLNENTNALPWAVVAAGKMLSRPIAISAKGTVIYIVPTSNAIGLLNVTALRELVAPGRF